MHIFLWLFSKFIFSVKLLWVYLAKRHKKFKIVILVRSNSRKMYIFVFPHEIFPKPEPILGSVCPEWPQTRCATFPLDPIRRNTGVIGSGFGMTCSPWWAYFILSNHPDPVCVGQITAANSTTAELQELPWILLLNLWSSTSLYWKKKNHTKLQECRSNQVFY